jgi:hypothetical protein
MGKNGLLLHSGKTINQITR